MKKNRKYGRKPEPIYLQNTVCFDLCGSKASHLDIYNELKDLLILNYFQMVSLWYLTLSRRVIFLNIQLSLGFIGCKSNKCQWGQDLIIK